MQLGRHILVRVENEVELVVAGSGCVDKVLVVLGEFEACRQPTLELSTQLVCGTIIVRLLRLEDAEFAVIGLNTWMGTLDERLLSWLDLVEVFGKGEREESGACKFHLL